MVTEGHSGTREAVFTITLLNPPATPVEVGLATAQGTATAGKDYYSLARILTFRPGGPVTQQVRIGVIGERLVEANETFFVNVLYARGAEVADRQGVGTIVNDDAQPVISISSATVIEGHTGFVEAVFTISLSTPTFLPVQVVVRTADGSALAGRDYKSRTTVLTFQPGGPLTQQVRVRVLGNRLPQPSRTFSINLSAVSNATLGVSLGLGTIIDDD